MLDIGDLDQYHKCILQSSPAANEGIGSGMATAGAVVAGAGAGISAVTEAAALGTNTAGLANLKSPNVPKKAFEWRSQGGATYICVRITMDGGIPGKRMIMLFHVLAG